MQTSWLAMVLSCLKQNVMLNAIQMRNNREAEWRDHVGVQRDFGPPSVQEHRTALRKVKGKAPGTDGWRADELLLLLFLLLLLLLLLP